MKFIRKWLDYFLEFICCFWLLVMVFIACWQVFSRYVLNSPSTFTEEFLRFSLVWLSMIGMAYVVGKQEHVSLSLLVDKLPRNIVNYWLLLLQLTFIGFAFFILIKGGSKASANAMLQISPVLQLSMGKVYYALPISGVLIIIYSILNSYDLINQLIHGQVPKHAETLPDVTPELMEKESQQEVQL